MNIDITKIVNDKIKSLEESGKIKEQIENSIEKTILGAITSALEDYSFKRDIEKQVSNCVSEVAAEIGFSAYNGFIVEKIKEITEGTMRDDIAKKIQKTFDDMLMTKHDGIKLSEIFDKYREWLFETVEESDKWDRQSFTCNFEIKEDGNFTHYKIKLSEEQLNSYSDANIEFSFCTYMDKEKSNISTLYFDGRKIGESLRLGTLTPVESLLANLYYNKTEIILDIDDVDDSDYYDIDN